MLWCRNCLFIQQIQSTARRSNNGTNCGIAFINCPKNFKETLSAASAVRFSTYNNYINGSTITYSSACGPLRRCCSSSKLLGNCRNSYLQRNCTIKSFLTLPGAPVKKKEFLERRIVGYSMEQMFDVISDVEHYTEFLPWCEQSAVKSRTSTQIVSDLTIGMMPVTESYTSIVTMKRPFVIRAESKEGGRHFSHMITNWRFSPGLKTTPKSCLIDFYVSFEFRSAFHAQIANIFFNEVVKSMANAFYKQAIHRYGPETIKSRKVELIPAPKVNQPTKSDEDNLP